MKAFTAAFHFLITVTLVSTAFARPARAQDFRPLNAVEVYRVFGIYFSTFDTLIQHSFTDPSAAEESSNEQRMIRDREGLHVLLARLQGDLRVHDDERGQYSLLTQLISWRLERDPSHVNDSLPLYFEGTAVLHAGQYVAEHAQSLEAIEVGEKLLQSATLLLSRVVYNSNASSELRALAYSGIAHAADIGGNPAEISEFFSRSFLTNAVNAHPLHLSPRHLLEDEHLRDHVLSIPAFRALLLIRSGILDSNNLDRIGAEVRSMERSLRDNPYSPIEALLNAENLSHERHERLRELLEDMQTVDKIYAQLFCFYVNAGLNRYPNERENAYQNVINQVKELNELNSVEIPRIDEWTVRARFALANTDCQDRGENHRIKQYNQIIRYSNDRLERGQHQFRYHLIYATLLLARELRFNQNFREADIMLDRARQMSTDQKRIYERANYELLRIEADLAWTTTQSFRDQQSFSERLDHIDKILSQSRSELDAGNTQLLIPHLSALMEFVATSRALIPNERVQNDDLEKHCASILYQVMRTVGASIPKAPKDCNLSSEGSQYAHLYFQALMELSQLAARMDNLDKPYEMRTLSRAVEHARSYNLLRQDIEALIQIGHLKEGIGAFFRDRRLHLSTSCREDRILGKRGPEDPDLDGRGGNSVQRRIGDGAFEQLKSGRSAGYRD